MKLSSNPDYCVSLLSELQNVGESRDTFLHSDDRSFSVHSAILSSCSQLLADLLVSNSISKALILPGYSSILSHFVSLVYTGVAPGLTWQDVQLLTSLCKELDMETSDDNMGNNAIISDNGEHNKHLTIETEVLNLSSHEKIVLRMPMSRVNHSNKPVKKPFLFDGFKRRIQEEYNKSPVGPYEGPFDQDPLVPLSAQLPYSKLSYEQYTTFIHSENIKCKLFKFKTNTKDQQNKTFEMYKRKK